jgi:hypothetical protein
MVSFHFDIADGVNGPLGMCARMVGDDREEALEKLRGIIDRINGELAMDLDGDEDIKAEEYVTIYINADHITVDNIDDEEDADDDDEEGEAA